ncbi:MAG: hypothetical protein LBS90_00230 [Oscillospiraceae bacterium]|jgi:hypothetical protein|nr:hypothetical protein [Oscillospiraceae bacterium]
MKNHDDDDGRVVAPMDGVINPLSSMLVPPKLVERFQKRHAAAVKRAKELPHFEITPSERRTVTRAMLLAGLVFIAGLFGLLALFLLFAQNVWFR